MKQLIESYAQIRAQKAELQREEDELKDKILDRMLADGINKQSTVYGTMSVGKRKSWEWPQYILEQREELKMNEDIAKKKIGYAENPYLIFRTAKEEETEEKPDNGIHV